MKRINLLSLETSNKIAAGEVVERPFSVVKELVENSIDSKASNIVVEIEDGGQRSIKILDNGSGIHPEDVEKAFLPHATSKIDSIEDVYKISSMGFRGEALASIASVSKVNLKTRIEDLDYGKEISINGGNIEFIQDAGCNIGTTIEVKDLFFNVPARQKFLKSSSRETAYISDILNRFALAHSDISFKLVSNGRKSVNTYGTGNIKDVIRSVYGKTISENITSFEDHRDIASAYGYIGNSEISRGSRNNQSIFVNKRYIKSKLITAAVEQAFKSFLTINKYPFFIVFVDIFPEFIDVNVHPTKSEVKFKDDRYIFKLVFDAVHKALRDQFKESFNIEPINEKDKEEVTNKIEVEKVQLPIDLKFTGVDYKNMEDVNNNYSSIIKEKHSELEKSKEELQKDPKKQKKDYVKPYIKNDDRSETDKLEVVKKQEENYEDYKEAKEVTKQEYKEEKVPKFPPLNIIGQFHSTYILAEMCSDLYLIDQHAAHEKILFEKYRDSMKNDDVIAQILIAPIVIELTFEEYSYYTEFKDVFRKAGFFIEEFGDNTITIREVPMLLGKPDVKSLFMDILDNLKNMGSGDTWEVKYNSIARLACKSAVKANKNLSHIEMKSLVEDLRFIDDPFTCPHGRPTIIKFTLGELEKKFKRIQ